MTELLRTNDAVLISAVEALLKSAAIEYFVADQNMSVMEGSIGALPRRMLIATEEIFRARKLLTDAGMADALPPG